MKNDPSIQEKLKAAKTSEDVVGIGKENGHEFTPIRSLNSVKMSWKAWLVGRSVRVMM
jgi:hypothetical protein